VLQTKAPTGKVREVTLLLIFYSTYHAPYGAAMTYEESGLKDAAYGPAGLIESGQEWTPKQREYLRESYDSLELAMEALKEDEPLGFMSWLVLLGPYLGDPGDASLVDRWRSNGDYRSSYVDYAINFLAVKLRDADLWVPQLKRMTSRKPTDVKRLNDELYALYLALRNEGKIKSEAVQLAAEMSDYSESQAWRIVRARVA
jgi:hypothetical protein